jgi:hypothetical protein
MRCLSIQLVDRYGKGAAGFNGRCTGGDLQRRMWVLPRTAKKNTKQIYVENNPRRFRAFDAVSLLYRRRRCRNVVYRGYQDRDLERWPINAVSQPGHLLRFRPECRAQTMAR